MKRKNSPDARPAYGTCEAEPRRTEADAPQPVTLGGALRLADLFALVNQSTVLLEYLRRLDRAARLVIGGNLRTHSLDRDRLERLRASVIQQAGQARDLQRILAQSDASDVLLDELAALIEFFEDALAEIGRQLGSVH